MVISFYAVYFLYNGEVILLKKINFNGRFFIIGGVIVLLVCLGGLKLAAVGKENSKRNFVKEDIEEFKLSDYYIYIRETNIDENFGEVTDSDKARKIAEDVWRENYGIESKDYENLLIYYDFDEDAWLVKADIPENRVEKVPHILIDSRKGKVLGVWREMTTAVVNGL